MFLNGFLEREECVFVDLGFCTQKLSKVFVELCDESFVRSERCLPSYTHIELSRSRFRSRLDGCFSCCIKNLKMIQNL